MILGIISNCASNPKSIINMKAMRILKFFFSIHSSESSNKFRIHLSTLSINKIAFLVHLSDTSISGSKHSFNDKPDYPIKNNINNPSYRYPNARTIHI